MSRTVNGSLRSVLACVILLSASMEVFAQNPAPAVSSISPTSGPMAGGTTVTITGTNFLSGATVTFGSAGTVSTTYVSSTTLTAITPANSTSGAVNVVVTNPDSQSATLWAVQQPLNNPGFESGTTGWNKTGFGTASVINNPSGAHSGNNYAQLTVIAPNTQVNYVAQLNGASQYLPVNPGDVISFSGWAYRADTVGSGDGLARWQIEATDINQKTPSYVAASPNNVTTASWVQQSKSYTVPTGKAYIRFWCQITGTNGSVTAQANFDDASFTRTVPGGGFTYNGPPSLAAVSPNTGSVIGGTSVTLTGSNFQNGATVTFGAVAAASVTFVNSTTLTATTPAESQGTVNVTVTNPDTQSFTLNNAFTFVSAGPTISSISPNSGPTAGGTSVTISGTNFLTGATVAIGGNAATNVTVVNSTTITATTAASATGGPANVVVTNPDSQSATLWAVQQPLANPGFESGTTGWTKTGFGTAAVITNNPSGAHSGNNYAQLTVVAPNTQVNYVAQLNGSSAYLPVNPGDVISFSGWTYRADTSGSGDGLARWQIEATDSNKANPSWIASNPNNVTTASWVQQSNTYTVATGKAYVRFWCQITATNGSVTAQANFDDATFTRTIPGGGFTYFAPPNLTSVNPTGGALAGGTLVTLGGSNFLSGATATFGTTTVSTTFKSSTQLTALTPPNSAGPVNVTVTNPDGQHSTLVTAYTYNPTPTITSIAPTSGPAAGGTAATISGSNFLNGATVTFGGVAGQASVLDASQISVTTPAGTPGVVNVVVTNPDNQSATLTNGFTFLGGPPTITSIAPTFGTANGGTAVNIHGTNFLKGATVMIGGSPVNNITFVGSTLLTGTTTAHVAGGADIVVTNPDTQSATYTSLLYNQGFESGNTLWSVSAKNGGSANIYNCSSTGCGGNVNNAHNGTWYAELNAPVPKSQPELFVADGSGKSMYFPVLPGDVITFGGWAYRVTGDGSARWVLEITDSSKQNPQYVSAPPANIQDTQWELQQGTYTIPSGKAFIRLYCEISGNTINATARFDDAILQRSPEATYGYTYIAPPYLTSISPNWGAPAGGTTRTAFGTGLCLQTPSGTCVTSGSPAMGVPPTVTVGGAAATNVVVNGTGPGQSQANQGNAITFFVPPGTAGAADVIVTTPDGQPSNTLSAAYTYVAPPAPPAGMTAIHHIIWSLQENRSFDQYLGQMNQYRANNGINDNAVDGLPLNVALPDIAGQMIYPFKLTTECEENMQPSWNAQHLDYDNGAMDGFMKTGNMFSTSSTIDPNGTRAMGYYDWTDLPYYYSLAFEFATSDRWFSAAMANTGANRAYTVAGTSLGSVGTPSCATTANCDPTYGGFPNMTIFDLLQQAGISWRYYYQNNVPAWPQVWAMYNKYPGNFVYIGTANKPATGYFADIQNESTFPQVVFIEENGALDEHPRPNPGTNNAPENIQLGANVMAGIIGGTSTLPSLLNSPSWTSSVFIQTYDEGGGTHDHVVPPMAPIPDGYPPSTTPGTDQPGIFNQYGMRLPIMVVSPWTIPHFVSHTPRDQTAILKLIETRFSLPPLTARDAAADNMLEFFEPNFASAPWSTPPPTCNGTTITTNCLAPQPTNGVCNLNLEKAPGQ